MNNNLHPFGLIFNIKNENCLKEFLGNKNGRGIVYIDLVNSKKFSFKSLSDEARKMCEPGNNVGGSSQISEAFSYELFARWGNTEIEKTEKEIFDLFKPRRICDYVCKINGVSVGVSVTRAIKFRKGYPGNDINKFRGKLTEKGVHDFIKKKLNDLKETSERQKNLYWKKQILHVWVLNEDSANIVSNVTSTILNDHYSNTLVVISKAEESDFIFNNNFKQIPGT